MSGSEAGPFGPGLAPAVSARLPGPKWLVERRASAARQLAGAALPVESEEEWRYSRIDEIDLSGAAPAGRDGEPAGPSSDAGRLLEAVGSRAATVRALAGVVRTVEVDPEAASLGVAVVSAAGLDVAPEGLGAVLEPRHDAFTLLADAFGADAVLCTVPAGVHLDRPIVVVHELGEHPEGAVVFPRTLVRLGRGARASVVELVSSGEGRQLAVPVVEVDLDEGAQLAYTAVQQLGRATWQVAYHSSRLGRGAVLRSFVAALGGDYARQLTESALTGEGSAGELLAVYLGDGSQVQDFRTFQEHVAARTRSELVFKGAVSGTARSVYTGLIHMHPGAKRADASQTNRNLVLSKGAHADSVPNLDIEENDVRCSHASAVGPIDEDQLFYLASRGVPPEVAERLVLLGFFEDLLSRSPEPGVADYLREVVVERLSAGVLPGHPHREAS
ncbi:MAG TPA: Fe-S cluster assembly protein SufD [Acidimicrobiales bacterium]|nr:Fe-S cluster assembly protein SufD [Acidimicrobiales bacterium]